MSCRQCNNPDGCEPGTKWPDGSLCPYTESLDPVDMAYEIRRLKERVEQLEAKEASDGYI